STLKEMQHIRDSTVHLQLNRSNL
ncbi:hypothetical protein JL09_g6758, partial [Pichia kudriavzevii]